jgi:hypothetical protein
VSRIDCSFSSEQKAKFILLLKKYFSNTVPPAGKQAVKENKKNFF